MRDRHGVHGARTVRKRWTGRRRSERRQHSRFPSAGDQKTRCNHAFAVSNGDGVNWESHSEASVLGAMWLAEPILAGDGARVCSVVNVRSGKLFEGRRRNDRALHLPRCCRDLFPVGDGVLVPTDESQAAILRHDDRQSVAQDIA